MEVTTPALPFVPSGSITLAWANHENVTPEFCRKVITICGELGVDPNYMMACMAFETGASQRFSPAARNLAGSSGTGLIQFMAATAKGLGTTVEQLAKMTQIDQLDYVRAYFLPYKGRLKTLPDVYMAILYPAGIGKADDWALFKAGTLAYKQNRGLDKNGDGQVTKAEAAAAVMATLAAGQREPNVGEVYYA